MKTRRESIALPFSISLSEGFSTDAHELRCDEILRHLPGKRMVCRGAWRGQEVVAKIYFHKWLAPRHWRRERRGIEILIERRIPTAPILYAGSADDRKMYVVILRAITRAQNLFDAWENATNDSERTALLERLISTVAGQHNAGIFQRDLHLRNFLIKGNEIFTLDGSEISASKGLLKKPRSLHNLGLLLAQLPPRFDVLAAQLYARYAGMRDWTRDDRDFAILLQRRDRHRERRKKHYLRKIFRESTAFACERSSRKFLVYRRESASPELAALLKDPDAHLTGGAKMLKRGGSSTVWVVQMRDKRVAIKRYNVKSPWHGLRRALRRTRAATSWRNAHMLGFYGIGTAPPLAILERRFGPLRGRSYFISEFVDGMRALEYFDFGERESDARRVAAQALKESLNWMARFRIAHGDLKATNIIFTGGKSVFTDLDAMRQYQTGFWFRRARRRDVKRLIRNWEQNAVIKSLFQDLDDGS